MATNFGAKIAINAYKRNFLREITRMWLLITGGFRGQPFQRRYFWLHGFKGICHGNQLTKIGKISMATTSFYVSYSVRVWFWRRVCAIREFICETPVHKGQIGVTMATNFGTKIAINAFLRETSGMWLLITGSFRGRPIWRRHFWLQGLYKIRCHGNQILAKIG